MNVDLLIKENKELSEEKQRYKEMWFTANNSLAKYRKLEEQLGCPLEVLGKALKNGIYRYNKNYEPNFRKEKVLYLGNENGRYYITWLGCWTEYLDNYKKTWWLKADRSE